MEAQQSQDVALAPWIHPRAVVGLGLVPAYFLDLPPQEILDSRPLTGRVREREVFKTSVLTDLGAL
jgi:hypothetical protein